MPEQALQRRLAAILAADVVGYSRLMERDEAGVLSALNSRRADVVRPALERYHGRVVKLIGDGMLAEFDSVVNAVACAIEIQAAMASANAPLADDRRIIFRIGINIGDVIVEDGDLFGDGVNIAARLEAVAPAGGICVSEDAYRQVRDKLDAAFEDAGEQRLKNLSRPLRVFNLRLGAVRAPADATPALPDKPSIAVLPFQNMSSDLEQDYLADGIVEDIITALSRFRGLFVIARNSSFTYKGRTVDVKQIGRELGVRYVLEGSVRKAGRQVRITGQLIDSASGTHLWAEHFDGGLEEIFDLQDQVTTSVVAAIAPKLEQLEIERSRRKPTGNLDAYDYFLRGVAAVHQWTKEANLEALASFTRATELDPAFASAYGMAARCFAQRRSNGWASDRAHDIAEASRLARRAAELGRDDAVALCTAGFALSNVCDQYHEGDTLIERALKLNPNLASAWYFSAWTKVWLGDVDSAIDRAMRAMRLSPHDPHMFAMHAAVAMAHFIAGRYAEAAMWAMTALQERPSHSLAICIRAASLALSGEIADARSLMPPIQKLAPTLRVSNLADWDTPGQPQPFARWMEGLRLAGLPE